MNYIDRLAIIIVGEYRTWTKCAEHTLAGFKVFKLLAGHIDWYFVTWGKSNGKLISDTDITSYFSIDNNLVSYKILDPDSYQPPILYDNCSNPTSYYRKAHLSHVACELKRNQEDKKNFIYDQVIEIRPDIFYRMATLDSMTHPARFPVKDNEYWTIDSHFFNDRNDYVVCDIYQRTTSKTHNIISNRVYSIDDFTEPHSTLGRYLKNNNITPKQNIDVAEWSAIRFTHLDLNIESMTWDELTYYEKLADHHMVRHRKKTIMNRLAVMLIGQYRTFAITHKYLFEFFRDRADQVDYYFVTWPTSGGHNTRYYEEPVTITPEDITRYFTDENLIDFKIVDDIPKKHTFYRMAYLSHIGARTKTEYENRNHFVYDQVVETRPDVYLTRSSDLGWAICGPLTYSGHPIETFDGHLFMDDCYIRSDSKTYNIIANRITQFPSNEMYAPRLSYGDQYKHDHHSRFADWLVSNNIKHVGSKDYGSIHIIRDPKLKDVDLNSLSADELNGLSFDYTETRPRPKFLSVYRNIEPQEFTATHNIFVEAHASSIIDSLRYAALEVDRVRYFQKEEYNWIRYIQNTNDDPDQFFKRLVYARTDTVYFSSDSLIDCNFYCHPDIFSLIGNVYKLREKYPQRTDEQQLIEFFTVCNIRAEKI